MSDFIQENNKQENNNSQNNNPQNNQQQEFKNTNQILVVLTHLSAIFLPFLGALIMLLISNSGTSVRLSARQSLGFQCSLFIWLVVSGILSFVLIGLPMLVVFGVIGFVMPIVAGVQSSEDPKYKYPILLNFILP
jgi:uncharacterized Tic20 family protein